MIDELLVAFDTNIVQFLFNEYGITRDKIYHFIFWFLSTFAFFLLFNNKEFKWKVFWSFNIVLLMWIIKEVRDFYNPPSNVEFFDVVASQLWWFFAFLILLILRKIFKN